MSLSDKRNDSSICVPSGFCTWSVDVVMNDNCYCEISLWCFISRMLTEPTVDIVITKIHIVYWSVFNSS